MTATRSLAEVAEAYVSFIRTGQHEECRDTLYAENASSEEPSALEGVCDEIVTTGIEAIKQKSNRFFSYFDIEHVTISDPFLHGNEAFAVTFTYKVLHRGSGEHFDSHEIAVFTVEGGKIMREVFYQQP
ncbi:MAG: nuclear transport factor 2 family protein [Pseudomonadota bacterium]